MIKIRFTKEEQAYLLSASFIPKCFFDKAVCKPNFKGNACLLVSEEVTDNIRDLLGERLQIAGFDEKYKLNKEGKLLQDLIDRFYHG